MTNAFIASLRPRMSGHFPIWREQRRYELAAGKFREAGMLAYAELFEGFAEQAALEIEALKRADERIAELDAKLNDAGAAA